MRIVFIHGWSVTHTNTYGGLPAAVAAFAPPSLNVTVQELLLARYVSFSDEVTVDDIARAMQHAIATEVLPNLQPGERFACVTHSTGGPVVRKWIALHHGENLAACPLSHLVMLAPANHGSALAQLGKRRLSRLKSFVVDGVEPGAGVLDWLELGSQQALELNRAWLSYDPVPSGLYPFVLTGQTIDRALYDNLNAYTDEAGSDGVVRVAAANLNYGAIRLVQDGPRLRLDEARHSQPSAFGVLPGLAHSGEDIGILRSVTPEGPRSHPTLKWLLRCLAVNSQQSYESLSQELLALTDQTQAKERETRARRPFLIRRTFVTDRYSMLVFRILDDRGNELTDYDLLFTAGRHYDPNHLPEGFFVDRQRNSLNKGTLTYYVNHDRLVPTDPRDPMRGRFGFKLIPRPDSGFAHYSETSYQGTFETLAPYLKRNQTLLIDIVLNRHVHEGVFRLTRDLTPTSFSDQPPGPEIPRNS